MSQEKNATYWVDSVVDDAMVRMFERLDIEAARSGVDAESILPVLRSAWGHDIADSYQEWLQED